MFLENLNAKVMPSKDRVDLIQTNECKVTAVGRVCLGRRRRVERLSRLMNGLKRMHKKANSQSRDLSKRTPTRINNSPKRDVTMQAGGVVKTRS